MREPVGECHPSAVIASSGEQARAATFNAMNEVRFANTQFLNEMCTYIGDLVSSNR